VVEGRRKGGRGREGMEGREGAGVVRDAAAGGGDLTSIFRWFVRKYQPETSD